MKNKVCKTLAGAIILSIICLAGTSAYCGNKDDNPYLGKSPDIYRKYLKEISDLSKNYKSAKTEEDKNRIKAQRKEKSQELNDAIAKFNQSSSIVGKDLPFKVMGNLPFTVRSVKVSNVDNNSVDFIIQVKIDQDIKDDNGKIKERTNIYFIAFDSKDNVIPHTGNWATNKGWIKLEAGTVYNADGHWNAKRVQDMGDFDYIKIMSKDDYQKLK